MLYNVADPCNIVAEASGNRQSSHYPDLAKHKTSNKDGVLCPVDLFAGNENICCG
jgi:hypothetical protein